MLKPKEPQGTKLIMMIYLRLIKAIQLNIISEKFSSIDTPSYDYLSWKPQPICRGRYQESTEMSLELWVVVSYTWNRTSV